MDINKLTEKLQEALSSAQSKAVQYSHQQVDVEHLLLALLEQERGLATSILNKANIEVDNLRQRIEQELAKVPKVSGSAGGPDRSEEHTSELQSPCNLVCRLLLEKKKKKKLEK